MCHICSVAKSGNFFKIFNERQLPNFMKKFSEWQTVLSAKLYTMLSSQQSGAVKPNILATVGAILAKPYLSEGFISYFTSLS